MDTEKDLIALQAQARALVEEIERKLARGTGDVTAEAAAAAHGVATPAPPPEASLSDRIAAAVAARPLSIEEIAQAVRVPVGRVSAALRPLRKRLWNAGAETEPRWFLPPAEDASSEVFTAAVKALVRARPMTVGELGRATNTVGSKRVWHALTRLDEASGSRLVREGDPRRPRYYWLDESADVQRLVRARR